MDQLMILAKNETGGEPFQVIFLHDEGKVKVTCSCPQGRKGELCQHKVRLASNDIMMLENPSQRGRLFEAHVWIIQSGISDALLELLQMQGKKKPDAEALRKLEKKVALGMKKGS
jgi:hypothetical protein